MKSPSSKRERPPGLGLSAVVGIILGITALIISLVFLALLESTLDQRRALSEAPKSAQFLLSSSRAERALIDIETGIRGAIVTGDNDELEPYYQGLEALPLERQEMLDNELAGQADQLERLDAEIGAFVEFSIPVSRQAGQISPRRARQVVRESKVRLDRIRQQFRDVNSVQEVRVAEKREEAAQTADDAVVFSSAGLGVSLLLLLFTGWYLRSRVLQPISAVADASYHLSEGHLDTRVSEKGRGAIVTLARSFNRMAAALQYRDRKLIEANRQLEDSIEEVEEASRMKSAFLANMSHEIRTPLNGVMGMNALLERTDLDEEQREYVRTAQASGEALMAVINDILDFSKIEAGRLDFEFHNFDLPQALETACDMVADFAHRKNIRLHCFADPAVPRQVNGDRSRFVQVLINLLTNAIKFTDEGEVVLSASPGPEQELGYMVLIEVRDTGIGIDPATRERLFEAFTQADASTTREFGGTGLGLTISAQLTQLMGGRITVDSIPGEGSTFTVYMPFAKPRKSESEPSHVVELRGLRVLVADPDPTGRGILDTYTSSWGMRATTVKDADEAVQQLQEAARKGEPYDVALVACDLNGSGPASLLERMEDSPALRSTRTILLAASQSDAAELRSEGTEVVPRPLSQSRLLDAIATAMNVETSGSGTPKPEPTRARSKARQGARILMAEDNEINRFFLGEVLAQRGFEYEVAENGRQALDLIAAEPDAFDLVLMDCQMPELDGYDATRELRRREGESGKGRLPVIAMTAHVMEGDREKCLAAGMDDYLGKPLDIEELDAKIDRWLSRSGS